jgi:aminoglycoside phosphotransferase family enzyme/predicted kinase
MPVEDNEAAQAAVVNFLRAEETHGGQPVEMVSTPTSHVFLAGDHAYKLKRARKLPFLDYSTVALRHDLTVRELELNRRTAPELYLGVLPITRLGGTLHLGGDGEIVDWVLHMRRFAADDQADHAALSGRFTPAHARELADILLDFHRTIPPCAHKGDASDVQRSIANVRAAFDMAEDNAFKNAAQDIADALLALAARHAARIDQRQREGHVRQCHGDMHLANVVLIHDRPVPFDAIEFSDDIACVDVLHDLAFPVMDLVAHHLPRHAQILFNRYLAATRDYGGLALMPLYLGNRALVRAMANGLSHKEQKAWRYVETARAVMGHRRPWLMAVGGLSGSGKSTLAHGLALQLAPPPGAVVIRSDEVRKRYLGKSPEERLDESAYTPTISARVFDIMAEDARKCLDAGWPVILDATYMAAAARNRIAAMAGALQVPFQGLWCDAPADVLRARVAARQDDASDANVAVLERQLKADVGDIRWTRINADQSPEDVLAEAMAASRMG